MLLYSSADRVKANGELAVLVLLHKLVGLLHGGAADVILNVPQCVIITPAAAFKLAFTVFLSNEATFTDVYVS